MAKSKYAPALFEKLQQKSEPRRRSGIPLPRWWRNLRGTGGSEQAAAPAATPETRASPEPAAEVDRPVIAVTPHVPPPQPERPEPTSATPVVSDDRPGAAEAPAVSGVQSNSIRLSAVVRSLQGLVRLSEGRFEFSLSRVGAAVLAGGLLVVLLVGYQLGKQSASPSAPVAGARSGPGLEPGLDVAVGQQTGGQASESADLRDREAPPPVPSRTVQSPAEAVAPAPAAPKTANKAEISLPAAPKAVVAGRVAGLNYIVVERFQIRPPVVKTVEEAKAQAEKAQKWLLERCGLETAVYPMSNGKGYELWTVEGFKHPEQTPQRNELADKIRSYGKLYAKESDYLFGCEARKYQGPAEGRGRSHE